MVLGSLFSMYYTTSFLNSGILHIHIADGSLSCSVCCTVL